MFKLRVLVRDVKVVSVLFLVLLRRAEHVAAKFTQLRADPELESQRRCHFNQGLGDIMDAYTLTHGV